MDNLYVCRTALCLAVSLALNGCAVYADKQALDQQSAKAMDSTSQRAGQDMRKVTLEQKWANQDVDVPFLASEPRPISREAELPLVLQGKVNITSVFANGGEADLLTLAKRIQDASGILVKVMPDALLPLSDFGPRLTELNGRSSASVFVPQTASANTFAIDGPIVPGGDLPAAAEQPRGAVSRKSAASRPLQGEQLLSVVLDKVTAPFGNYWKWDPTTRQIVIYRTETRIFEVRGAEVNPSVNVQVNLTGAIGGETGNNAVDSKSATNIEQAKAEGGQIGDIVKRITQFMTRSGKVANGSGGMIIVTDTKDALDQIQTYIDLENKVRSRAIDFTLEEITVESTRSTQAGWNNNLLFSPGGNGNGVNVQGLNSLLEQEGAAASFGATIGTGPWKGSSVALQALSKIGKVVGRQIDSTGSNNGVPVTIGSPERRKYVDKLDQTQAVSDNSRPTVSATQGVEVSGRVVTIVPYAYSNGDANLVFKFDNTVSPKVFEKNVFPDGSYVQSPSSKSTVLARAARVHSGQPYVISATVVDSRQYNANRVDPDAPMVLGGSDIADKTERVTLLVLTAMVKEQ